MGCQKMHKTITKVLFWICTLLSLFFIVCILTNHIAWVDHFIYVFLISFKSDFMTNFFLGISNVTFLFVGVCILVWIFEPKKILAFFVSFHLLFPFIVSNVLKLLFRRERPSGIALTFEPGYSMPSSHAMVSVVFVGFLCFLLCRKVKKRPLKIFFILLSSTYIFLICCSRIYLGVHYASDVTLGFLLGILYLLLFFERKKIKTFFKEGA